MDPRKHTPRHIIITLPKIKEKERILKAPKEKETVTYKGVPIRISADLSKETLQNSVEDGGEIGGSRVHFPSTPVKHIDDLRSRANSQQYSSIYEDRRPKIEDIERSDGKKSA